MNVVFHGKWTTVRVKGPMAGSGLLPPKITNGAGFLPDQSCQNLVLLLPLDSQMPPPDWHEEPGGVSFVSHGKETLVVSRGLSQIMGFCLLNIEKEVSSTCCSVYSIGLQRGHV